MNEQIINFFKAEAHCLLLKHSAKCGNVELVVPFSSIVNKNEPFTVWHIVTLALARLKAALSPQVFPLKASYSSDIA